MSPDNETISFERALEELELVVKELESHEIGLDESLARYERGVQLLRICRDILDRAERRIALLTGVDAQGNPVGEEFDARATAERAAAACEPAPPEARSTARGARRPGPEGPSDGELLF